MDVRFIRDYPEGNIIYQIVGNRVVDYATKRSVYEIVDHLHIRDCRTGNIIWYVTQDQVRGYTTGRVEATFDKNYIREGTTGTIFYQMEGRLSRQRIMMYLAIVLSS